MAIWTAGAFVDRGPEGFGFRKVPFLTLDFKSPKYVDLSRIQAGTRVKRLSFGRPKVGTSPHAREEFKNHQ